MQILQEESSNAVWRSVLSKTRRWLWR